MLSGVIVGGFQCGEKFWEKLIEAFSTVGDTILDRGWRFGGIGCADGTENRVSL